MNETFAKILSFTIIFWIVLGLFATIFAERMHSYILSDDAEDTIKDYVSYGELSLSTGVIILFDVMTWRLVEQVPIWITALMDIMLILTGISIVMALTNR